MNRIRATLVAAMLSPVAGCVILPYPLDAHTGQYKQIDEETITFIQAGITNREDVLLRLGAPDWAGDKRFIYGIDKDKWGVLFVVVPFEFHGGSVLREYKALVIEFDANWVVTARRIGESSRYFRGGAVSTPDPSAMPAATDEGGVTVGADPYIQPRRQQAVFGAGNFAFAGVLPIQLVVKNGDARRITVWTSSISLELSDGRRLNSVSPQATTDLFSIGQAGGVGEFERTIAHFALSSGTLNANQSRTGFIYFILPPDVTARQALVAGIALVVGISDDDAVTPQLIKLPVKGQG